MTVAITALGGLTAAFAPQTEYQATSVVISHFIFAFGALDLAVGRSRRANLRIEIAREFILL